MTLEDQEKTSGHFNFWLLQNRITYYSLIAILLLSAIFATGVMLFPAFITSQFVAFIVLIPALACLAVATCHASNLESSRALKEFQDMHNRVIEAEGSQITLDRFFSISSDLMAVAGKDGLLKKVSRSLIKTLGYNEQKLLSTPFVEFIHPDDRESTRKNIESLNMGVRSVGFENRYQTSSGDYRTLSWSAAADMELGVRFASARDITDERNFQIRVQKILDVAPFLLVVKDTTGIITSCNAAFANAIGVDRDLIIARHQDQFKESGLLTSFAREQEVIESQRAVTFDEDIVVRGVQTRYHSTVFPIHDQMGEIASVGKVSLKAGN
ncbi:PAS domain-containing protein [Bdellovibrio sp. HCB290]|uniref:PAS domain-containing protein n=1 Tax=Bdellovibrio sp. HCB290 TaxID=3394356 RepID=UPI0039B64B74